MLKVSADIGLQLIIPAELFISARAKKLHAFVKEIDTEGEAAHTAPAGHGGAGPIRDRTANERRAVRQHDQQDHQQKCHLAVPRRHFRLLHASQARLETVNLAVFPDKMRPSGP